MTESEVPDSILYTETAPTGFFETGAYSAFLESCLFSDVTLISPDGKTIKAHRMVLAAHSDFFKTALNGDFVEASKREIQVNFDDPLKIFDVLIGYFYSGKIELSAENVFAIYAMAERLQVARLKKHCEAHLATILKPDLALKLLERSLEFAECAEMGRKALDEVAVNFDRLWNREFGKLPLNVFDSLLAHPKLNVRYEFQVLYCTVRYTRSISSPNHPPNSDPASQAISSLFHRIRFQNLPNSILVLCPNLLYIPRPLLLDAAMARLSPSLAKNPRASYIGNEFPDLHNLLTVYSSSVLFKGSLVKAVGSGPCITMSNGWIGIELPHPFRITSYAFNPNWTNFRTRSWVLEGTKEPETEFMVLDRREDSIPLGSSFSASLEKKDGQWLRFVRIRGTEGVAVSELRMEVEIKEMEEFGTWCDEERDAVAAAQIMDMHS